MLVFLKRLVMAATVMFAPLHAVVVIPYCIARLAGYVEHCLGDFNLTDLQVVYDEMTHMLRDAHAEAGYGLGFTRTPWRGTGPPTWRIDFVFYTPELVALSTEHGNFGGSDHRPVVAELAFRNDAVDETR